MGSQINTFLLILIVSLAVGIPLAIGTSLPSWLIIILSPAAAIGLLRLFSSLVDHLERPKKIDAKKQKFPNRPFHPIRQKCPKCGSANVAQIFYGLTAPTEDLKKDIEEKRITLGGCMVYDGAPEWHCNKCSYKYGSIKIQ